MRRRIVSLCIGVVLMLCGCGEDPNNPSKLIAVSGKVFLDGRPLTAGVISFVPDEGNPYRVEPSAPVGASGEYQLTTGGRAGAPPGKYKVCVTLGELEREKLHKQALNKRKPPTSEIRRVYAVAATTPLAAEVVAHPPDSAYDLTLTSK
jgi:hypothetical protein